MWFCSNSSVIPYEESILYHMLPQETGRPKTTATLRENACYSRKELGHALPQTPDRVRISASPSWRKNIHIDWFETEAVKRHPSTTSVDVLGFNGTFHEIGSL